MKAEQGQERSIEELQAHTQEVLKAEHGDHGEHSKDVPVAS